VKFAVKNKSLFERLFETQVLVEVQMVEVQLVEV
jgi:hypothetical protein